MTGLAGTQIAMGFRQPLHPAPHREGAAPGHRVDGVVEEVDEDLFDLHAVKGHRRKSGRKFHAQRDLVRTDVVPDERERILHERVEVL